MPIQLLVRTLKSREVRAAITNVVGERILQVGGETETYNPGEDRPSFLERLFGLGRRVVGFIISVVSGLGWSFTRAFTWLVSAVTQLTVFNFNASDADINQMIRSNNVSLASLWGGVFGGSTGWLSAVVLGIGAGFIVPVIGGQMLASVIAGRVGQEALEEVAQSFADAMRQSAVTVGQNMLLGAFKHTRSFLKRNPPSWLIGAIGEERFEKLQEYWGAPGGQPWTIAGAFEQEVEELPGGPIAQAFAEEFADEFFDSLIEGGYIIAGTLDEMWQSNQRASAKTLGEFREVVIKPDRENNDEQIHLVGHTNLLMPTITNTLTQHQLLYNRDVGEIVGQPAPDWYRSQIQRRKLTIKFIDKSGPPLRHDNGDRVREATYSIPDIRAGVDWSRIKRAARTYIWGKFRATANLDNGRQMAVYGATPGGARDKLEELMELSTAEIISMNISEEVVRHARLRKEPTQMWPYKATLLVRRGSVDLRGRTDLEGNTFDEELLKFSLWPDEEPPDMPVIPAGGEN